MSFRDINRGPELKIAYDNLRAYEAKSKDQKATLYKNTTKNTKRANHARVPGYILPFDAKAGQFLETRVLKTGQTGLGSNAATVALGLVADQFKGTLTGTEASLKVKKYKFARIIVVERTATATTPDKSRFTDNPYLHHTTVSASCPFGATAPTQTYAEAVKLITAKAAFGTFEGVPGNSITFDPQG